MSKGVNCFILHPIGAGNQDCQNQSHWFALWYLGTVTIACMDHPKCFSALLFSLKHKIIKHRGGKDLFSYLEYLIYCMVRLLIAWLGVNLSGGLFMDISLYFATAPTRP